MLTLKDRRGREVARNVHFFVKTKELKLPETSVDCEVKVVENGRCEVVLSSPRLAKDVFVQVPEQGVRFSDNFFDLLPGERRRIVLTSPMFRKGEKPVVTVKHIRETYQ